ncbi:MAG TPA: phosphatase PAP2 family protein [Bryobacteraceae bacterium]|nr:phosphatase PAP2 family protein [Bryobacteraceae bacterium]
MERKPAVRTLLPVAALCLLFLELPVFGYDEPDGQTPAVEQSNATPAEQANQMEDARERVLFSEDTERFKPLISKLIRNTLMDQKEIWVSPFHMKRGNEKWWWIGIGGATAALISVDRRLSSQLPNTVDQMAWSRRVSQVGAAYTAYPIAGAFYLGGALFDNPKARETGALGAEALTDSLIVVSLLKLAFGRERPLEGEGKGKFFQRRNGFPSGHAMMSFAFASVVSHEYRKGKIVPILAYGVSTLISASRFSGRKHFASDIIAGAGAGYFIGTYVFKTHEDHAIHKRHGFQKAAWLKPTVSPQIGAGTYGVSLAWNQ